MNRLTRISIAAGAAVAGTAAFAGPAAAAPAAHRVPVQPARVQSSSPVFVQTDNPSGNSVVVYDRNPNGTLREVGVHATGGLGGVLAGSVVDHLASQGSLVLDRQHGLLYAVNAGSNTITVFAVRGDRLQRTQVLTSGGNFPVSIATHGNAVYVLNARDGGSIQGYLRVGDHLVRVPLWHRTLGLDPGQTPEFTSTPGQVAFTPDGRHLLVTTKGNGSHIDVFAIDRFGGVSARPVVNSEPGTAPFAVAFDRFGHVDVAESGTNSVASYQLSPSGRLSLVARAATGQQATCWITVSGNAVFASNAGSGTVSGYVVRPQSLNRAQLTATGAGTVDAAVSSDGRNLYVQTGAQGAVDEFRIGPNASLTKIGSVTVPGAVGGEGIAAG